MPSTTTIELELYANNLITFLHKLSSQLFPTCIAKVELLHDTTQGFGKIRTITFTTMGVTKKNSSTPHVDTIDIKENYIMWLLDSRFLLSKYLNCI
jgi:hypothetical protein